MTDIDGKRPRVLLRGAEIAYAVPLEWSRDGHSILAVLTAPDRSYQLALVSAVDGAVRLVKRLGNDAPLHASLSPDGNFVAYDQSPQHSAPSRDLFIVAVDGSIDQPLVTFPSADLAPVWTPDGARIVLRVTGPEPWTCGASPWIAGPPRAIRTWSIEMSAG